MTPLTSEEASRQLQCGVLTAVMHIASVRVAGAAPLAIEYSAALERVTSAVSNAATPDGLKKSFESGLPLSLLKEVARQYVAGDRRLRGLRPDDLRGAIDQGYEKQYQALVIAAAEAALKVEIEEGPYRRRYPARWELYALDEIRKALDEIRKAVQPDA